MSGGFGRKGVAAGAPAKPGSGSMSRPAPRNFTPPVDHGDGLSPAARAFIAAERGRVVERDADDDDRGVAATSAMRLSLPRTKSDRSMMLAYVLWWFSGVIGAHRFYLGARRSGLAMLGLLFGGLLMMLPVPLVGVAMICAGFGWTMVDAFLIPGLMRQYKASHRSDDLARVFA